MDKGMGNRYRAEALDKVVICIRPVFWNLKMWRNS
jgi:hypothetical protein